MAKPFPQQSQPATHIEALHSRSAALLDAMVHLFKQGQNPHHKAFPAHFGPAVDHMAIRRYLLDFLKPRNPLRNRAGFAKGWYVDGALAGYLLYRLGQTKNVFYGKTRWNCYIEDIVVDQRARGSCGGSELMQALWAEIEHLDDCVVSGTVWGNNAASQALFRKHGFEPLSQVFCKGPS
jgi:ribosomal protein S18 acetylase RimI-like enzyme